MREKERERDSICWYTPKMTTRAEARPGQATIQEGIPCDWQESKHLGHLPLLPGAIMEQLKLKLVPIWDAVLKTAA